MQPALLQQTATVQPIRLHANPDTEKYGDFDADSRRRDARLIFRFNRRPISQAGRSECDQLLSLLESKPCRWTTNGWPGLLPEHSFIGVSGFVHEVDWTGLPSTN